MTAYDYDDLCGSFALVRGDDDRGAPLKARPHALARTLTNLGVGRGILLCQEVGGWHGVVVTQDGMECLDRDNRDSPRPYVGPCVWGWLRAEHVDLSAG